MHVSPLPKHVASVISSWPHDAQQAFGSIRMIVFDVLANRPEIALVETLKWGQPSWLPDRPGIGSTLRINWHPSRAHDISLYVNCNTTLSETLRGLYPEAFVFEGRRGLHISLKEPLPEQAIAHCATLALSYHCKNA